MNLSGSSAIVTGGASGLGHAVAGTLAAQGAEVVVVDLPGSGDRDPEAAVRSLPGEVQFLAGDVTDPQTAAEAVKLAAAAGPLRVLVNCAGVVTPGKLLGKSGPLDCERFMKVVAVNTGGTVNMMGHAAEQMRTNEASGEDRGVIINTSSVAAYEGQIGQIAYSASMGAVASLTVPAARELAAHAIRVVSVAPGIFETPMISSLPEAAQESLRSKTLHPPRLGRPEDFAKLVTQIIDNPMLNGETIRLDGAIRLEPV